MLIKAFSLVIAVALTAAGQTPNWLEVPNIVVGKHVKVELKAGKTQQGVLEAIDANSLTIKAHAAIARSDIRTVKVRGGMSRGKRAIRGAKIGAVAGGVLYGSTAVIAAGAGERNGLLLAALVLAGVGFSTGVGALIGVALPHSYQTIYTAP